MPKISCNSTRPGPEPCAGRAMYALKRPPSWATTSMKEPAMSALLRKCRCRDELHRAQRKPFELACLRARQRVGEHDDARVLVWRNRILYEFLQFRDQFVVRRVSRAQHDERLDDLAARFVGRADHAAFGHRVVLQ